MPRNVIQNDRAMSSRSTAEAHAAYIEEVVAELLPPRRLARQVDLGQAGQARPDGVARLVARDRGQRHGPPLPAHFLLVRPQGPGPDEAHVALEDVDELGQLVHGRGPQDAADLRHARVAGDGLDRPARGLGAGDHGPELEGPEDAAPRGRRAPGRRRRGRGSSSLTAAGMTSQSGAETSRIPSDERSDVERPLEEERPAGPAGGIGCRAASRSGPGGRGRSGCRPCRRPNRTGCRSGWGTKDCRNSSRKP
ncbi:MAG: hypothetical protein MZV64_10795 [Ignavibacteriales bacterium]|nr:hypothetical protein [Ignavibacteriales bacterium]